MTKDRIMIVEDEKIIAQHIKTILSGIGYDISGVTDTGEDAVVMAGRDLPDLVLMDNKLKGEMDGAEAGKTIWKNLGIPIVFLTAFSDMEILERSKEAEPLGYIVKPFSVKDLEPTIKMALHKHRKSREMLEKERQYRELVDEIREKIQSTIGTSVEIKIREIDDLSGDLGGNYDRNELNERLQLKYSIKDASRMSGVKPNLIRTYQRMGLINPYRDPDNNYRSFTLDEIEWIERISRLIHEEGLNIEGIRRFLTLAPCWETMNCAPEIRKKCAAKEFPDIPCWNFNDSEGCARFNQCYKCRHYITVRNHSKLQIKKKGKSKHLPSE